MPLNPVLIGKVLGFLLVLSTIISVAVRQPNNFRIVLSHLSLGLMVLFTFSPSGNVKFFSSTLSILCNIIALLLLIFYRKDDKDLWGLPKGNKPGEEDLLFYFCVTFSTSIVASLSNLESGQAFFIGVVMAVITYGIGLSLIYF